MVGLQDAEVLKLKDVHTFYGKSHIIQGISLSIQEEECIALLGRNGTGKTTTLRSIMGLNPPQGGEIFFKGRAISGKKPFEISREGIGYVPEDRRIFVTLTVLENLRIAKQRRAKNERWSLETIFEAFPLLAERRNHRGSQLSGGEQQMLTIARSLMGNPELLLIDEPTEGLAPLIIEVVVKIIQRIKNEGTTIFLVEQNLEATYQVADLYYILQQGLIVYHGSREEFRGNPQLKEEYLGV
ncbi:MAG: ATP-binding cassette domain-containing protein [candidate division Zixibacteria bacterium]|nr:ATP-binding cassette domain-containing protein [candidate division Zixibacteria bacterium]